MATWTVDRGLEKLLAQLNAAYPNRYKTSDGSIGDESHLATASDHNPETPPPPGNPDRQVDARDFTHDYTHDPTHGADMSKVSEAIRLSKDPRVAYVIFNRRIFSGPDGPQPWVWRPYGGSNPHDKHMHVSVRDVTHDQTQDWQIGVAAVADTFPNDIRAWTLETVLTVRQIKAMLTTLTIASGVDPAALEAAMKKALADQLPQIADAVVDEQLDRLKE